VKDTLGDFSFLVKMEMFHIRKEVPGKSGAIFCLRLGGGCVASVGPKSTAVERFGHQIAWWLIFMVVYDRAGVGGCPPVKMHLWPCRLVGRIVVDLDK
jgi:hypothetical protein